jgi:hypothetical protein
VLQAWDPAPLVNADYWGLQQRNGTDAGRHLHGLPALGLAGALLNPAALVVGVGVVTVAIVVFRQEIAHFLDTVAARTVSVFNTVIGELRGAAYLLAGCTGL